MKNSWENSLAFWPKLICKHSGRVNTNSKRYVVLDMRAAIAIDDASSCKGTDERARLLLPAQRQVLQRQPHYEPARMQPVPILCHQSCSICHNFPPPAPPFGNDSQQRLVMACLYKNPVAVILCTTPQSIRLLCVDGTFYTPTDNVSGSIWSRRIRRVYTYLLIDSSHLSTSATYNLQSTGLFDYWNQIRISVLYMQIDMIDLDVLIMSRCTIGFYWWMTRLQQKIYGR